MFPFENIGSGPSAIFPRTSRCSCPRRPRVVSSENEHALGAPSELRPLQGIAAVLAACLPRPGVAGLERTRCLPWGLFPSSTWGTGRPRTFPGFASPGYVPSSGFLTPMTVLSAPYHPGVFHPGSASGVLPFRAFPFRGAVAPLDARCLLDVSVLSLARCALHGVVARRTMARSRCAPRHAAGAEHARLRGFAPLESPLHSGGLFRPPAPDALLGLCLPGGFASRASPGY